MKIGVDEELDATMNAGLFKIYNLKLFNFTLKTLNQWHGPHAISTGDEI